MRKDVEHAVWNSVDVKIEDVMRQRAWELLRERRSAFIGDSVPLVFLTNAKALDEAMLYGKRVRYSSRPDVPMLQAVQPLIHGQRLLDLINMRAAVPVRTDNLDVWSKDVETALWGFGQHLVDTGLLDVEPRALDLNFTPLPGEILIRWQPTLPGGPDTLSGPETRYGLGCEWDWERNLWRYASGPELKDPLRT